MQRTASGKLAKAICRIFVAGMSLLGMSLMARGARVDGAETSSRFARTLSIPNSVEVIVVSEGDFEPRSSGSYALRVYGGAVKKFPLDDFVTGVIRPRQGMIDRVLVDGAANESEIVVVIRSVGTGGYLSADLFRYRARSLVWVASVAGLDKRVDPLVALREEAKREKTSP